MKVNVSFTLCRIKGKDRYRWYVLFRNPETGERMTKKSVENLRKNLGDFSRTPILRKTEAYEICIQALDAGVIFSPNSLHGSFRNYLESYWDWENSPAIQRKITIDPGSIGPDYAATRFSLLKRHVIPLLPSSLSIANVTSNHLRQLQYELVKEGQLANITINQMMSAVFTALKDIREGSGIPFSHIRPPKALSVSPRNRGILSENELRTLLARATRSTDRRLYLAASLSLLTGMRAGELRALTMKSIGNGLITVDKAYADKAGEKPPKGKRSRHVPCPISLCNELKDFAETNPYLNRETLDPLVFWSRRGGGHISSHFLPAKLQALLLTMMNKDELTTRNITFHSFRHMANTLLRGTVDESTLRMTIGHQSEEMSDIYTHMTQGRLELVRSAQERNILPFILEAKKADAATS
ncbi:tyrosine-type recombinase/integrase [Parasphaerochaeta coccoides]|uniref:Integrase family protein n=1 Tax=Parasphaerochaeta coccoides (strain ATCC BAA-1237 / DSM 17374 / SPN1) TaxID=760011 RepID=F4GK33_PARC1|nr:site-specific integrase [Parasphaerochaeta coccoides]AEC01805.1 integrase family protein [Parasphaerochaeta coccoides DSM 17374]